MNNFKEGINKDLFSFPFNILLKFHFFFKCSITILKHFSINNLK